MCSNRQSSAISNEIYTHDSKRSISRRGTLLYAMKTFDCEPFLAALVNLARTGNFEFSTGTFGFIEKSATSL